MRKFLTIIILSFLVSGNAYASCYDDLEVDAFYFSMDEVAKTTKAEATDLVFDFKNKTDKLIKIVNFGLKSKDGIIMRQKELPVARSWIAPFGKLRESIEVGKLNTEVAGNYFYACKYSEKVNLSTPLAEKKKASKDSGGILPSFKSFIIFIIVLALIERSIRYFNKPKSKNYMPFSKKSRSSKSSKGNFIEDIWEGRESLAKTFWLYLFIINGVAGFLFGALSALVGLWVLIFLVGYNIWISVGTWRSADNYKNEKLKRKQKYGYAIAAKIYVVLALATLLSQIGFMIR